MRAQQNEVVARMIERSSVGGGGTNSIAHM